MPDLTHIAYRGFLRSCNYCCTYCPFSKQQASSTELAKDHAALKRFVDKISQMDGGSLTVQVLPYGEALIHNYYWIELARLSRLAHVRAVGCQTNLSFRVSEQLTLFRQLGGEVHKLRLWCTFHPAMTTVDRFVVQCTVLRQEHVRFSVGAVGDPAQLMSIVQLRQSLPEDIYLWINRLDGLRRAYTTAEQETLSEIDPYFPLELKEPAADVSLCSGGRTSLFVQGDGSCYSCNLNRRRLGNFYNDDWQETTLHCSVRRCSCYLAYALRQDLAALTFFDQHPALRVPILAKGLQPRLKTIFFDLDGTLLNGQGLLRERLAQSLPWLTQHYTLYLATQRPQQSALRLLGDACLYFTGGVFADGAYVRPSWNQAASLQSLALSAENLLAIESFAKEYQLSLRIYREREVLYKVTLQSRSGLTVADKILKELQSFVGQALISRDESTVSVVSQTAGKWQGMLALAQTAGFGAQNMAYVGNAACDAAIFAEVAVGIAMADGASEAVTAADYVLADW